MKIEVPLRRSPVALPGTPAETELRDGWPVILCYEKEDDHPGPWLVDLSHRRRWDFQDRDVVAQTPMDLPVPERFGQVGVHGAFVVNRMNRTQVSIWHLGQESLPRTPRRIGLTETTDGHCMLAFAGTGVPRVLEQLTPLALFDPARRTPFLTQGPVLQVPCQIVTLAAHLVVMTLARGYGATFADAALRSGGPVGLTPGGERRFGAAMAAHAGRGRRTRCSPPGLDGPTPI